MSCQVENCGVTISSHQVGAVAKQEDVAPKLPVRSVDDDFPALGKAGAASKKEKTSKSKETPSPVAAAAPASTAFTQVTVLLDASGWSLKMASLDALRSRSWLL